MTDLAPYFACVLDALYRPIAKAQHHAPKGSIGPGGRLNGGQFLASNGLWDHDPNQELPIVKVTGEEMGGASENTNEARHWALDETAGEHLNTATGWSISVSARGIREAISKLQWPRVIAVQTLAAIPELIREAVLVQTEPNKEDPSGTLHAHTFIAPLEIGGQIYRARLVVKETNMGRKYYGHHLEDLDIEMPEALSVGHTSEEEAAIRQHPGTLKISHLLNGFKPHEEK